jgi:hypothetical protein
VSYSGLYSGLYVRLRDYAQLMDDVLIGLKTGNSGPNDARRKELADLLLGKPSTTTSSLSAQILQISLQTQASVDRRQLDEVGKALLAPEPGPALIAKLEMLASALEQERAGIVAKMRGHT